jgi:hypothetical protein
MGQLLEQAVALLTEAWGSSTLAPLAMCGTMACVQLPAALAAGSSGRGSADSADAKYVQVGAGGMAGWFVHALLYMDAPLPAWDYANAASSFHLLHHAAYACHQASAAASLMPAPLWTLLTLLCPAMPCPPPTSQDLLHYKHKVECPVKCLAGRLYVRISAAPYNVIQDYQVLADAVGKIAEKGWAAAAAAGAAG